MKRSVANFTNRYCKITGIVLLSIISITCPCIGQSVISGMIVNWDDSAMAHANVLLLHAKDSSLTKGTLSADDGSFNFENIADGEYIVMATYTGFRQMYTPVFSVTNNQPINLGKLMFAESTVSLHAVTVISKKPLYENKPGRIIVNVQNSVTSAGNTALDVLERSPGIIVNRQTNSIAMEGKDGVAVMINGKINYMPADAVLEMLQGMNAGNIEKIELINTPPANLDADGHGGYINIILKSNNNSGTNGSYSATIGYGQGFVDGANLNINHRNEKINVYGNFSYSRLNKPLPIETYVKYKSQGDINETYFVADRGEANREINARVGLDYQISKNTVLGALISGYNTKYTQSENNINRVLKNGQTDTIIKQHNHELKVWQNISANFNVQHDFNENSRISVNLDYIYYQNDQPYDYYSAYYNNTGSFIYDLTKRSNKFTPINFCIGAIDYTQRIGKKLIVETGFKTTTAIFLNDLRVERYNQGIWSRDSSLSTRHKLNENYNAFYTSFDLSINSNTHAKFGFRYEYSNYNLKSITTKDIIDRHYGNLFPVVSLSHKLNANSSVNLYYNMRIARPTFTQLAAYAYFINESISITGNPALQPSISNTIRGEYSFKKYLFAVSASKEDRPIWIFQPKIDSTNNKITLNPENLSYQKLVTALISIPVNISNWWSMQYNITGIWQEVAAAGDNPLKISKFNININASERFTLRKNFSIELSGFYQSKSLSGVNVQRAYGSLDFGIKKKLAGKNGSLIFSATNLLNSQDYYINADIPEKNLSTHLHVNWVQRAFKLTYTRNFGNDKLKERRERATGAEEEKERVQ